MELALRVKKWVGFGRFVLGRFMVKTLDSILLTSSARYNNSEAFLLVEYYDAAFCCLSCPLAQPSLKGQGSCENLGKIGSHGTQMGSVFAFLVVSSNLDQYLTKKIS